MKMVGTVEDFLEPPGADAAVASIKVFALSIGDVSTYRRFQVAFVYILETKYIIYANQKDCSLLVHI